MALTVKKVDRENKPGRHFDSHGLYLQITKTGGKSWVLRYERGGKSHMLGLGSYPTFSLDEARERARLSRQKLADGVDPIEARKSEKAARAAEAARQITFKQATKQYYDQHEAEWKNRKHAAQFLSTLEQYAYPEIGEIAVAAITTGDVLRLLEKDNLWHTKTETASRVRGRIEKVLGWAAVRGYRTGDNPARWVGHLKEALPSRAKIAPPTKHAALAFKEMPSFMTALRARSGIAARALEFTILTGSRTGEVAGAQWSEFDFDKKVWTVPAERMKAGREHRIPLSDRAIEILNSMPRELDFVFIGGRKGAPMSNMAMAVLLRRMERADITVHGFRSSFRDWAAEMTAYPNHVAEMALAHTVKGVEAHYRRGDLLDKRRKLMQDWAVYCASVAPNADNVTPLRNAG